MSPTYPYAGQLYRFLEKNKADIYDRKHCVELFTTLRNAMCKFDKVVLKDALVIYFSKEKWNENWKGCNHRHLCECFEQHFRLCMQFCIGYLDFQDAVDVATRVGAQKLVIYYGRRKLMTENMVKLNNLQRLIDKSVPLDVIKTGPNEFVIKTSS